MSMNVLSIKKARRFYALSCITSPGGKHRGLAGSVAVLIAESLLMLITPYIGGMTGIQNLSWRVQLQAINLSYFLNLPKINNSFGPESFF